MITATSRTADKQEDKHHHDRKEDMTGFPDDGRLLDTLYKCILEVLAVDSHRVLCGAWVALFLLSKHA